MTVIRNNSISGINSITAQSSALNFYDSTGNTLSIGASVSGNITGAVTGNLTGNVTVATGATISGSTNTITASTNGSERLRITSDGTILAGGQTASYDGGFVNLELRTDSNTVGGSMSLVNHQAAQAGATCEIDCYQNYRAAGKIVFGRENSNNWQSSAAGAASFLAFYTNSAGTNAERLRVTSGGNVGIGTDNPGAKTHIDSTTSNTPLVVEASQNNRSRIVFRNNVETGTECSIELIDDDLRFTTNSGERLRIDVNGKIQINNATPTLEFNGTQQSGTASADLLWNLRDGNANDYDVVKITGQNSGNGGYGDLIVQTAYNNTLKNRIVVSNAGISSFIGYTANTDVLRVHDGTVQINDSLNQNNWQLQVKNTNNSFATGNSLIRAEYTGTNSSDNIKVFSGYVTSESAETCYIAGNGMFYGKGVTALRDNSVLFGKYESGGATIDITSLTSSTWRILEVFGSVNPNSGGSSYVDPLHMYVYNGKGWNGSALTHYIYTQHIAPPARDIFPSGTSNSGNIVDAVWYNGSTESDTCPSNSGSHYVRLKCYNYNTTYGSSFNVRYFVRR